MDHNPHKNPDPLGILREASRAAVPTAGLTLPEVVHEMAERIIELTIENSQARRRGEELEAENRELRMRIQELERS